MATVSRLTGILLLILVGYHYINQDVGLTVASSVAVGIFGACLVAVYAEYKPDIKNWMGWALITGGCSILAGFSSFSPWLLVPSLFIVVGFRLAELSFDLPAGGGDGGYGGDGGGGFFDSCDGDSGSCGD